MGGINSIENVALFVPASKSTCIIINPKCSINWESAVWKSRILFTEGTKIWGFGVFRLYSRTSGNRSLGRYIYSYYTCEKGPISYADITPLPHTTNPYTEITFLL